MRWLVDPPLTAEVQYEQAVVDYLVCAGVPGVILPPLAGNDSGKLAVNVDDTSVFFRWLYGGEFRAVTSDSVL